MPHLWNNILVVTEAELVPAWYNCLKTLQSAISRYKDKDYGIKKVQRGGNGRQMLIAFDSLPTEIRNGMGDPRKHSHVLELFYKTDAGAVSFFTQYRFEDGAGLSLQHQEEYITNASVLAACDALRAQRVRSITALGGTPKKILTGILADATSFNKTLQVKHGVQHTLPESDKRFKEAFKAFVKENSTTENPNSKDENFSIHNSSFITHNSFNYASLLSGRLRNQNRRKVTDEVLQLLSDLFAGQATKPTRTDVARVYDGFLQGYVTCINGVTGELYDAKNYKPLSENTILNYLGAWGQKIGTYTKRGGNRQQLIAQFRPHHSLERPQYAGSIISVDDRQPPFEYAKGERVWFYNGIDLGSEAFTCWVHGKSKEGIITEFYRQMVRNYAQWGFNLPLELEAEASLNSSFVNTFLQPGRMFEHVRIEANNARGKRIERYFGNLRYGAEKEREGWLARPFALREANQAGPGKNIIVPYETIVQGCLRDIENWNNAPHSVHKHKSRWDVFTQMQHPATKPINWRGILPSLGYRTLTSCNVGIIRLNNGEFLLGDEGKVLTGQRLIDVMEQIEGRNITCIWLDDNSGNVLRALVFYNDCIVCEAVSKPVYSRATAERTPADNEARTIMSSYVSTIDAYMKTKIGAITEIVVIDNRPQHERKFTMPELNQRRTQLSGDALEAENMGSLPNDADTEAAGNTELFNRTLKDRI